MQHNTFVIYKSLIYNSILKGPVSLVGHRLHKLVLCNYSKVKNGMNFLLLDTVYLPGYNCSDLPGRCEAPPLYRLDYIHTP